MPVSWLKGQRCSGQGAAQTAWHLSYAQKVNTMAAPSQVTIPSAQYLVLGG